MNFFYRRQRRRTNPFVAFVCFCKRCFNVLSCAFFIGSILAAGTPASETAKRSGTLRLALPNDPQTLDPALVNAQTDFDLTLLLNLPLLDITNGSTLVNYAAAEWNSSPDARTFTFHLRPELRFSNGRPVVAADYAYALERINDPQLAAPYVNYLKGICRSNGYTTGHTYRLAGVRYEGLHTLKVELETPDAAFPYLMANVFGMAVPHEEVERLGAGFGVRPVGNGPYQVEEWTRGVRLVFKPNPYYRRPEHRRFDRIEIMIGGDEFTHLMMFEQGELDLSLGIPIPDRRRLVSSPRWNSMIEQKWALATDYVVLNNEIPPLDNVKIRQAINYAVDKPRRMYTASGRSIAAKGMIAPDMPGFNTNLVGYPYNPSRAKELLAESGITLPIYLSFWHSPEQEKMILAQGIQADLHAVGIETELKGVTYGEILKALTVRKRIQMCLTGWTPFFPDPKDVLWLFDGRNLTTTPPSTETWYTNSVVDQMLDKAAVSVDRIERHRLYQAIEEIVVRDAPVLFLGHPNLFALRQPWLKGSLLEPLWFYRFDRVWIER